MKGGGHPLSRGQSRTSGDDVDVDVDERREAQGRKREVKASTVASAR